jgi:hypothetical protein
MMDLYYHPASPACRIVQLTAKALNIDLNLKFMDVMVNEHHEPEFVKVIKTDLRFIYRICNCCRSTRNT